jgi:hypothetical protein
MNHLYTVRGMMAEHKLGKKEKYSLFLLVAPAGDGRKPYVIFQD